MKCYQHPDRDAVGMCVGCGNPICQECNVKLGKDNCCKACKDKLAATAQEREGASRSNKWLIGLLIGCGGFFFLAAIGGIVAAMLLPALSRAKGQARRAVCMSNLKQIGLGLAMYTVDYDEQFPENLSQLYPEYASAEIFCCPSDPDDSAPEDIETPEDAMVSYRYIGSLSPEDDSDSPIVYEDLENHGNEGCNVLFIDGHVEWIGEEEFKRLVEERMGAEEFKNLFPDEAPMRL